jgi:predicted phosphohydrolase
MWTFLWMSDIHLDYLTPPERSDFLRRLGYFHLFGDDDFFRADGMLVGGDISRNTQMADDLRALRGNSGLPLYYVPGNHDYYGGTIRDMRAKQLRLHRGYRSNKIYSLELIPAVRLGLHGEVGLVGHGCWGDTRSGDYDSSDLHTMADFREIWDFKNLNLRQRKEVLMKLGDEAAAHLKKGCSTLATHGCEHVVVLTHVPPFPEASTFEGKVNDKGLPYVCCQAAGAVLQEVAKVFPHVRFTVLSGHSHEEVRLAVLPNLKVLVRKAAYYEPSFDIIKISTHDVIITETIGNKGSLPL